MKNFIISEKNRINDLIKTTIGSISNDEQTILKLKANSTLSYDFVNHQVGKLMSSIEQKNTELVQQTAALTYLEENNDIDEDTKLQLLKNTMYVNGIAQSKKKEKDLLIQNSVKHKILSETMEKELRQEHKKNNTYYYNSSLNHFNNNPFESLPQFLKSELNRLNETDGIVYKGIFYFGMRVNSSNKTNDKSHKFVEFKKGYQTIHEWNKNQYIISNKEGKKNAVIKQIINRNQKS